MNTDSETSRLARVNEGSGAPASIPPKLDAYESADQYVLLVDLPGVDPEGISVEVERGELTIAAQRPEAPAELGDTVVRGFQPAYYRRQIRLPTEVESGKIQADYQLGVLELKIPKSDAVKPRRIAVTAA